MENKTRITNGSGMPDRAGPEDIDKSVRQMEFLDSVARVGILAFEPKRIISGMMARISKDQDIEEMTIGEILALRLDTINEMEDILS